jgi:trans-2,3-dihydro-3-hydroxyanthranilate isomerase
MTQIPKRFNFIHCDVFATRPYSGNSLAVFTDSSYLSSAQMLTITQELRHFESIFLSQNGGRISARIFDLFEELPFAGHPLIGAACALHAANSKAALQNWEIHLQSGRSVSIQTTRQGDHYTGAMDQGQPQMISQLSDALKPTFAKMFNLAVSQIADLPLEIISTGLKYLIVPVNGGLAHAKISAPDLETRLHDLGAEFAYLLDVNTMEGRHWNNDGIMEDVATGSAAGVVGAYALKHGLVQNAEKFTLRQGRFMGRPSEIQVTAFADANDVSTVTVAGGVVFVGSGEVIEP